MHKECSQGHVFAHGDKCDRCGGSDVNAVAPTPIVAPKKKRASASKKKVVAKKKVVKKAKK